MESKLQNLKEYHYFIILNKLVDIDRVSVFEKKSQERQPDICHFDLSKGIESECDLSSDSSCQFIGKRIEDMLDYPMSMKSSKFML